MTDTVSGAPPYMAPEREQGRAHEESDVYALAAALRATARGRPLGN